jgi:hypothetical protein
MPAPSAPRLSVCTTAPLALRISTLTASAALASSKPPWPSAVGVDAELVAGDDDVAADQRRALQRLQLHELRDSPAPSRSACRCR